MIPFLMGQIVSAERTTNKKDKNMLARQIQQQESAENQQRSSQNTVPTVYIDGSCIRNGTASVQAGIGLFWGDGHPWNSSISLTTDSTHTNNKAELMAVVV